jgi:hypothetical protein
MTFEEASAFVSGTNNFGWLHVHYDYDSAAWVAATDQTGTTVPMESGDRLSAQTEALDRYGKTAAGAWVYSGSDEDGSKAVVI